MYSNTGTHKHLKQYRKSGNAKHKNKMQWSIICMQNMG